jgi:hypothetical protein
MGDKQVLNAPAEIRKLNEDLVTALTEFLQSPVLAANVIGSIEAAAGADLVLTGATGKEVKVKLTDAAGARKFEVLDSADVVIFSVDSDGDVVFTGATGTLTGDVIGSIASHDYSGAHANWTLNATEKKATTLIITNADAAVNIIGPSESRGPILVKNGSGFAATIKKSAGTGVEIANNKYALVMYDGTDYIRITPDT